VRLQTASSWLLLILELLHANCQITAHRIGELDSPDLRARTSARFIAAPTVQKLTVAGHTAKCWNGVISRNSGRGAPRFYFLVPIPSRFR